MNHVESHALIEALETRYGITVEQSQPGREEVETLKRDLGQYAHFMSRSRCCYVRKQLPLRPALYTWISGLRADQSDHRSQTACKVGWHTDESGGRRILKLNPLFDRKADDLDCYIREHDVPLNTLYDLVSPYGERFNVIGCVPCHIPVKKDLDVRAGIFPWENGLKERGLHGRFNGSQRLVM